MASVLQAFVSSIFAPFDSEPLKDTGSLTNPLMVGQTSKFVVSSYDLCNNVHH